MPWLAVTLNVVPANADALVDALLDAGAVSVDVADAYAGTARECPQFNEPGAPASPQWELAGISALFGADAEIATVVPAALAEAGYDPAQSYVVANVADQDWVRAVQADFLPVHVSPRVWVVPTWHVPPDPDAINLIIDPGLAFGTGTHPTTRLCLEWLDHHTQAGQQILDYGCGSGILAIAAMKLGAGSATAIDIDPAAVLAARENAMQNQTAVCVEGAEYVVTAQYDTVVANILANPLKVLAPLLARATRRGGRIGLSGILEHQAGEVIDCYTEWFDMALDRREDGWVLLAGTRLVEARPVQAWS
jgi:ribosomal protein L11 methyltransferase